MRCTYCNTFVSYEGDEEPTIDSEDIDMEGNIFVEVTLTKNCGSCGQELASVNFTLEDGIDVGEHHGDDHQLSLECDTPEQTERTQTQVYDKRKKVWKPITSSRYMKHYYGVEVAYKVQCSCGEEIAESTLAGEEAAGSLESCQ